MIDVSWTVYNYRRPENVGVIKYLSERT